MATEIVYHHLDFDFEPRPNPRSTCEIRCDIKELTKGMPADKPVYTSTPVGRKLKNLVDELKEAQKRADNLAIHISYD